MNENVTSEPLSSLRKPSYNENITTDSISSIRKPSCIRPSIPTLTPANIAQHALSVQKHSAGKLAIDDGIYILH